MESSDTKAPFQIWNEKDHQQYISREKDDQMHATTVHQALVDKPIDTKHWPQYVLPPTTGNAILTESDPKSIKLEHEESTDCLDQSGKIYKCQIGNCARTFITVEAFLQHLTQHRTKCADCDREFNTWSALFYHA